ncbi:helix-turn-helix transcriptional regulator [Piscinibacter sakaiensis]|uniref:HTH cro/C1-type domain-containing protein n=1 Tax=Piscinibacter sakaiensis TaxID=1547922 RepID=A0A0K8P576_PISS1|nr:helix-turn-helix transcriptional regulator [Piscinibacter sakaiensis]GAP37355.1 hypothetical protein ISF6_3210 [Piscinibacter sakaiensis]
MDNSARRHLAKNVNALVNTRTGTLEQLVKALGVSNGTLGRIRNAEVETGVDKLTEIAAYFGIEPWQLLAPKLGIGLYRLDAAKQMEPVVRGAKLEKLAHQFQDDDELPRKGSRAA